MIRNILFDFGGVLVTIDHTQAVRRFSELGLHNAAEILNPYTQCDIFGDLESGIITAEDFRRQLSVMVKRELTYDECKYAWMGYIKEVPKDNMETVRTLRQKGYRTILLSNTNPFIMSWAESDAFCGCPISSFFDALYKSYEVKLMKPDEKFFKYVLEREGILAGKTLFVDDGKRNIEVASAMGIQTYCPVNGEKWHEQVYQFLQQ